MLGKISKQVVERLPLETLLWDTTLIGFGVRRQRKAPFYLVRYRIAGRQRFLSIGRHGSPWTPDTARREAKRLLGVVAGGTDPALAKAEARQQWGETLEAEVRHYLERKRSIMKPRAYVETSRHLLRHAKPLHHLPVTKIDRRMVAQRLAEIETGSGAVTRNRVRSSLSAFFTWAIREGLLETNPVAGTGKGDEGGSRERALTETELATVWQALAQDDFGDIVRLLILTGQRREEIRALRRSEIDWDRGLICLPPERTKNRRLHELPMSPQVRAILQAQPHRGDFVFGLNGFSGAWSRCKARLDARAGIAPFRIHDLRRTAATMMADKLGVLPHIIEAILNHVSGHKGGVAGVYNRARYENEMRVALERWAEHVTALAA
jgi:integrase